MPRRTLIVALGAIAVCAAMLTGTAAAREAGAARATKAPNQVRMWASIGPRAMLANAKVTLKDASGKTIATGRTSKLGSYTFILGSKSPKLPLTIRTSGGSPTALLPNNKIVSFGSFKGHMAAQVFGVTTKHPITQVSLISTVASDIAASTSRKHYSAALDKVEHALGFSKSVPDDIMGLRNSSIGFRQLMIAARRAGGFDAFAEKVAEHALSKKKVSGLRPPSASASGAISQRLIRGRMPMTRQSSSTGPICSAPLPSGASQSDEIITDVAAVGVGALMKVGGTPSAASASITGMAFAAAGVPTSQSTAEADNAAIYNELLCINEQLVYLTEQVDALSLSTALSSAVTCANAVGGTNAWQAYQYTIGDGTSAPIDMTDPTLTTQYVPTWNSVNNTCGSSISNSLFKPVGSAKSGWQQMVNNTVGSSKWWTQAQNQQLQSFLSYWGSVLYQQYILANEYDNFMNLMTGAKNLAGATTLSSGQTVCSAGSTANTSTACVWSNNITQAYPADLYSDELGVVKNGMAMNAIPLGVFAPKPIMNPAPSGMASSVDAFYKQTPTSTQQSGGVTNVNPGWFFNYYLNFTPYNGMGYGNELRLFNFGTAPTCVSKQLNPCPGPTTTSASASFAWNAVSYWDALGVNPKGYGTAVETYNNPQTLNRTPNNPAGTGGMQCSDVSDVNSTNNLGQTGLSALYNTINQAPNGGSGPLDGTGYGSGDVLYMVNDGNSYMTIQLQYTKAYLTWNGCMGNMKTGAVPLLTELPIKPFIATITGRPWWNGASGAATYTPPAPPTS